MTSRTLTLLVAMLLLVGVLPGPVAAAEDGWSVDQVSRLTTSVDDHGAQATMFLSNDNSVKTFDPAIDQALAWLGFGGTYSQRVGWGVGTAGIGGAAGSRIECGSLIAFCDSQGGIVFQDVRAELRLIATSGDSTIALWRGADGGTIAFDAVYLVAAFALGQALPASFQGLRDPAVWFDIVTILASYGHELATAVRSGDIWRVRDVVIGLGQAVLDVAVEVFASNQMGDAATQVRNFGTDWGKKMLFPFQLAIFGAQLGVSMVNSATNIDWDGQTTHREWFTARYRSGTQPMSLPTATTTQSVAPTASPTAVPMPTPAPSPRIATLPVISCGAFDFTGSPVDKGGRRLGMATVAGSSLNGLESDSLALFVDRPAEGERLSLEYAILGPKTWRCTEYPNDDAVVTIISPGGDAAPIGVTWLPGGFDYVDSDYSCRHHPAFRAAILRNDDPWLADARASCKTIHPDGTRLASERGSTYGVEIEEAGVLVYEAMSWQGDAGSTVRFSCAQPATRAMCEAARSLYFVPSALKLVTP